MSLPVQTNTRRRLPLLFCVPLAFSLLFFLANQLAERTDLRLLQIQNLSMSLNALLSLSKDVEIGERGFLLTGDERYLAPLQQAKAWLPSQKDLCRTYVKDQMQDHQKVERILSLVQRRFDHSDQILETLRRQNFAVALDLMKSGSGQEMMDQIRMSINGLQRDLDKAQSGYLDRQKTLSRVAFLFFLVGTAVMIVVLIWLYNALISYIDAQASSQGQLQAFNKKLEILIDERTRELQVSNEELQQFAYVASHDLQEPLRTITSFTQLLESRYKGKLDEDADEFIGYIVSSSRRMTDLINGLLTLARLRKAGQPTNQVSFEKIVDEAEASLQASIRESDARVEKGPLPSLVVDELQLTQVFQNLISNAIKYKRQEAPVIRIEAQRKQTNWVFCVSDNGQGFETQYAERIFGIFQRLHDRTVAGTGMGLSITRRIIERHGGRIWAESKPGVGSSFYFSLPASLETVHQEGQPITEFDNRPAAESLSPK